MENQEKGVTKAETSKTMSALIQKMIPEIGRALPRHMNADRMARIAMTEFRKTPALARCNPMSVIGAIVTASQLGLEPGVIGQCYLIPYGDQCQFVPGWQGIIDLVARTGRATAWTGAVYEGDQLEYELGSSPYVKHIPCGEDDPAKLTHVYAVGRVNGADTPIIEVWPIAKIWKHRDRYNKVGQKHYSYRYPEMYARKVPLLQVVKYLPKSVELTPALGQVMEAEIATSTGEPLPFIDIETPTE